MRRRSIIAALILGIALSAGSGIAVGPFSAFGNTVDDENDRVVLHGNVHPKARPEFDVGPTDPSLPMKRIILLLKIAPDKQTALDQLVVQQQDRSSPNFHRWLTPEEFGQKFGRSPEEIDKVKGWLISHGLTVEETAKGRDWINFSGTAAQVESAFRVKMRDYSVNGKLHHANSNDPSIPRALADIVAGPVTLHNFLHKPAHSRARPIPEGKRRTGYTYSDDQGNSYQALSPGDFAVIYDLNAVYVQGYDGTGVTIAVVEQTRPKKSPDSWNTFRSTFGLSPNTPQVIVNGTDPGDTGVDDDTEADLDVEWAGAVAPGATIYFVVSGPGQTDGLAGAGVDLSAQYIVDNNLAPIVSDCYGTCEPDLGSDWMAFYNTLWEQAASQGITVFVVSGDTGAYDCSNSSGYPTKHLAVNGLASTPYNIAVGGTRFNYSAADSATYWNANNAADYVSALGYIPELAWNDLWAFTPDSGYTVQDYEAASGGGASSTYTKPAWQASFEEYGVPSDGARDLPDVSLNADDINVPYLVYTCTNSSGPCTMPTDPSDLTSWPMYGGTSAATPTFAGIMALLVQRAGGVGQGNFNVALYQFGQAQYGGTPGALQVFNPITSSDSSASFCTNSFIYTDPTDPNNPEYNVDLHGGYNCGSVPGYNQVTGLGSVDALNLLLAFEEGLTLPYFTVTAPSSATAGTGFNFTVKALDASGNVIPDYFGIVHFTSTDGSAKLPADASLTKGSGTFSATLNTGGSQTITATFTGNSSVTGTSNAITVPFPVNGACGSANGEGFSTAPTSNLLCNAGTASEPTGSGPWNWTCAGSNGGTTISCSAYLQGECGSSNGQSFFTAPKSNLCSAGKASVVKGTGPWSWTCVGLNGGSTADCSAKLEVNGACGSANKQSFFTEPASDLCASGSASAVKGTGPWSWTCAGSNGGITASCSAKLEVNGACGSANGKSFLTKQTSDLCKPGTASKVTANTAQGTWNWTCTGSNGGSTASCSANIEVNGACGSANGKAYTIAPTSGLCSAGTASAVSEAGRWDWTCIGSNGGSTASCSAKLK